MHSRIFLSFLAHKELNVSTPEKVLRRHSFAQPEIKLLTMRLVVLNYNILVKLL